MKVITFDKEGPLNCILSVLVTMQQVAVRAKSSGDGLVLIVFVFLLSTGAFNMAHAQTDAAGNTATDTDQLTIDRSPIVSIVAAERITNPADENVFDVIITYSDEMADFDESELDIDNATATGFSTDDDIVFAVPIEADDEDTTIEFGDTRPTAVLSSDEPDPTSADEFIVKLNVIEIYDQPVSPITASDFTVIGAIISAIDDTNNPQFLLTIVPVEEGEISIRLKPNVLTDAGGNRNRVSNKFTIVYRSTQPSVAITSEEPDPTNAQNFAVTFTFDQPVFGFEQSDIEVNNATLSNFTGSDGDKVYTVTATPDSDGLVTIVLEEGAAQNIFGNDSKPGQFAIESNRTPPAVVSIVAAEGITDPTNEGVFDVIITFSEILSDFDENKLNIDNASAAGFNTDDDIIFTVSIVADNVTTFSNTIQVRVPQGVFTDLAGNENEADDEGFTIVFGDTRPTAVLSSDEPDPTNSDEFVLTLSVTEIFGQPVSQITASDFTVSGAVISAIDDTNNPEFLLTIAPVEEGEISIQLDESILTDAAGNRNRASNEFTIVYNSTRPSVAITSEESDPTNAENFAVTFTFDQPVFGFEQSDIEVSNATLSDFTGSDGDEVYTVTVTPDVDGLVRISLEEGAAQDAAGNDNNSGQFTIESNRTPPTVVSIVAAEGITDPTNESVFDVIITFSEELRNLDQVALVTVNADIIDLITEDHIIFTVSLAPQDYGLVILEVPAGVGEDLAGNVNKAGEESFSITYSVTPQVVTLKSPADEAKDIAVQPEFDWEEAARAETYELQIAVDPDFAQNNMVRNIDDITETSYILQRELNYGQTYYWRMRARNVLGNGSWSEIWTFTTRMALPVQVVLKSPLDSAGTLTLRPELSWEEADHTYAYHVEIAEDNTFGTLIKVESGVTGTSYQIEEDLDYYGVYHWRVRAENSSGFGEWSEQRLFITKAKTPQPHFPVHRAQNISIAPQLSWGSPYQDSSYELRLSTNPLFTGSVKQFEVSATELDVSGLDANTEYFWNVRLSDELTQSEWTAAQTFITRSEPETEEVSVSIDFGRIESDRIDPEDYQMLGLPGSQENFLDEVLGDNYGDTWRAFTDTGADEDFLSEFDLETNRLSFEPGRGFWVIHRNPVEMDLNIIPVIIDEKDSYAIEVHKGWNIIANPFAFPVLWTEVQDFNKIDGAIYVYDQLFNVADSLRVFTGYYFYNDPQWGLDKLRIPYGDSGDRRFHANTEQVMFSRQGEAEVTGRLGLQARFSDRNGTDIAEVEVVWDYKPGYKDIPYPPLEMSRYGVAFTSDKQSGLSRKIGAQYIDMGTEYNLTVKAPVGKILQWEAYFSGLSNHARVLLINPASLKSLMLADGDIKKITISEPKVTWQVFVGDEVYLREIKENQLPDEITLRNNYPNPFNPVTNITYALVEDAEVRLEIFDIVGRRVQTLVQNHQPKGWHTVTFEGRNLASGVYIYRLVVGQNVLTKKMILIK